MAENPENPKPRLIKPARLRAGATVALIAPCSPPADEKLAKGIANLTQFGFKIVEGKSLRAHNGHLAGTDEARLEDLHWAFRDPAIEAVIDQGRRAFCQRTLEKKDLGDLLRSLREGHPVGYAPDQNFNLHMAFVPFFGQPAATLTMTSRIARLSRAPVLCVWITRQPSGYGYRLRVDPPLAQFPSADPVADTARIIALLEAEVRKTPEQYLWAHRRFKTRPNGSPAVYAQELLKERHR